VILVRNVFRLKFGTAREAIGLWREGIGVLRRAGVSRDIRVLTDLAGPFYTLVVEETFESLGAMEDAFRADSRLPEWREFYSRFATIAETGERELYTIIEEAAPG